MSLGNIMSVAFGEYRPMSQPVAVRRQGDVKPAHQTVNDQWNVHKTGLRDMVRQSNSVEKGKIIDIVL